MDSIFVYLRNFLSFVSNCFTRLHISIMAQQAPPELLRGFTAEERTEILDQCEAELAQEISEIVVSDDAKLVIIKMYRSEEPIGGSMLSPKKYEYHTSIQIGIFWELHYGPIGIVISEKLEDCSNISRGFREHSLIPHRRFVVGTTTTESVVENLEKLRADYTCQLYNAKTNNCVHFCQTLQKALVGRGTMNPVTRQCLEESYAAILSSTTPP